MLQSVSIRVAFAYISKISALKTTLSEDVATHRNTIKTKYSPFDNLVKYQPEALMVA